MLLLLNKQPVIRSYTSTLISPCSYQVKMKSFILSAAIFTSLASAQSPLYGQCGGQGWNGPTTCAAASVCTYQNPYYSQCLPASCKTIREVQLLNCKPLLTMLFSDCDWAYHDTHDNNEDEHLVPNDIYQLVQQRRCQIRWRQHCWIRFWM